MTLEELKPYLEDIETRIDPETEQNMLDKWLIFARDRSPYSYFKPSRKKTSKSPLEWPSVSLTDVVQDPNVLIYQELRRMNQQLEGGTELLGFRSNYGTVIIPSIFGVEIIIMPREQNCLPGNKPFADAEEGLRQMLQTEKVDIMQGYAKKAFETARYYQKLLCDYPKLRQYSYIYMPDTESPMSVLESIAGSDVYYLFYDEPELVSKALNHIADVIIQFGKAWFSEFPPVAEDVCCNWGWLHRGHFLLREDSCTSLSPDLYEEIVFPADRRIFEAFGGGAVHFCGHGDHLIELFSRLPGFHALNMSQPDMNDMDIIYANTIHKDAVLIGIDQAEIKRCLNNHMDMCGRVQGGRGIPAWMADSDEVDANPA